MTIPPGPTNQISGAEEPLRQLIERERQALLIRDVGIALTRCDGLNVKLQRCAEAVTQHLDAAFARIWTLNEKEQVLELQASAGIYTHLDGPHGRVPVGKFKIGLIAEERKPHLTNQVVGDPRVGDQEWARREGMISFAGYPLIVEDRLVGVMAMFGRRPLSEATLSALASVADGIALGIDQAKTEEALRRRERELTDFIENASVGLHWVGADGTILWANQAELKMLGYTAEEYIGRNIAEFHADSDVIEGILHRLTSRETLQNQEARLRAKDGTIKHVLISSNVWFENDEFVHTRCFTRDITERKRAEEALRQSEERYRTLARNLPNSAVSVFDKELRIVLADGERLLEAIGFSKEMLEGKKISEILPPDLYKKLERDYRAALAGEASTFDAPFAGRHYLSHVVPLKDDKGEIVAGMALSQDITDLKRAEERLASLLSEREQMLEEVSTPVVPVWKGVLVLPIVGALDSGRMQRTTDTALREVTRSGAQACIIDITGARIIDSQAVASLTRLVSALKLIGAEAIVTGVSAQAAQSLVGLGLDLEGMRTHRTLAEALSALVRRDGL